MRISYICLVALLMLLKSCDIFFPMNDFDHLCWKFQHNFPRLPNFVLKEDASDFEVWFQKIWHDLYLELQTYQYDYENVDGSIEILLQTHQDPLTKIYNEEGLKSQILIREYIESINKKTIILIEGCSGVPDTDKNDFSDSLKTEELKPIRGWESDNLHPSSILNLICETMPEIEKAYDHIIHRIRDNNKLRENAEELVKILTMLRAKNAEEDEMRDLAQTLRKITDHIEANIAAIRELYNWIEYINQIVYYLTNDLRSLICLLRSIHLMSQMGYSKGIIVIGAAHERSLKNILDIYSPKIELNFIDLSAKELIVTPDSNEVKINFIPASNETKRACSVCGDTHCRKKGLD